MRRLVALHTLLALGVWACGYRLVRYPVGVAQQRRVAIGTLRNDSLEPGLEFVMRDALQREFLRRGAVRIVEDPDAADLVVGGVVLPVVSAGRSFSSVNFALEYELTLRLRLSVTPRDGEPVELDGRSMSGSEFYLASADVEVTRRNRAEALRRVASLIATRVHDTLVESSER